MRSILIIYFVGINLVTFLLYGVDKWKVVALDRRKLTFRVVVSVLSLTRRSLPKRWRPRNNNED